MALKTYLTGHGFRVDLTHVKSTVISLHHIDGHSPGIVTIVTNAHTRIVGHHVGMNGQNSFGIRAKPCNLKKRSKLERMYPQSPKWHDAQCLKITQNVAFGFLILAFSINFCPFKSDLSGNAV